MIVEKKVTRITKSGRKIHSFLIRCDSCGKEEWFTGNRFETRKYCSHACINKGRTHSDEWVRRMSKINSGAKNPFHGKKHTKESRSKMSEVYVNPVHFMKDKLSDEEYQKWFRQYCENRSGKNNSFFGKTHTPETRRHMSETRSRLIADGTIELAPSHYGLKGYFESEKMGEVFRHDSFIERLRMMMLDIDPLVLTWTKRHGIRISYEIDGNRRKYIPDFLIHKSSGEIVLEEVKGYENPRKKQAKFDALKEYCEKNSLLCSIVTYNDIDDLSKAIFGKSIYTLRKEYKNV